MNRNNNKTLTTQMKIQNDEERMDFLKRKKRVSRNDETVIFDAMIYLLVKVGYRVKIKRSKKTTKTIKMFLPNTLFRNTERLSAEDIMAYSPLLLQQLGYESISKETIAQMTAKRLKRTKEARMNNGVLYLLQQNGYTFVEKKVKKANYTERLVRVDQFTFTSTNTVYSKDELFAMGNYINMMMNVDPEKKFVELDEQILNHGPLDSLSFDSDVSSVVDTNTNSHTNSTQPIQQVEIIENQPIKITIDEQEEATNIIHQFRDDICLKMMHEEFKHQDYVEKTDENNFMYPSLQKLGDDLSKCCCDLRTEATFTSDNEEKIRSLQSTREIMTTKRNDVLNDLQQKKELLQKLMKESEEIYNQNEDLKQSNENLTDSTENLKKDWLILRKQLNQTIRLTSFNFIDISMVTLEKLKKIRLFDDEILHSKQQEIQTENVEELSEEEKKKQRILEKLQKVFRVKDKRKFQHFDKEEFKRIVKALPSNGHVPSLSLMGLFIHVNKKKN